ncbi:transposase [Streptomyces azureus]|uniref:Transposase n=1 Tax=Streptomyces azureus TaxID=146537 RepID=A0A0K8PD79_STRAJ|nr:transposase [Streptomyces azureus]
MLITPGQWGDAPQLIPVMERIRVCRLGGGRLRTRPDQLSGDKAYSSRRNRRYLRRRQIKHTIPKPNNQRANRKRRGSQGGWPAGFDKTIYKRRNEVERTINALKNFRRGHEVRQAGLRLPRHDYRCRDPTVAQDVTGRSGFRAIVVPPRRCPRRWC